jgi:hypothetical protein
MWAWNDDVYVCDLFNGSGASMLCTTRECNAGDESVKSEDHIGVSEMNEGGDAENEKEDDQAYFADHVLFY